MRVWFEFKHDVRAITGERFICARVFIQQPPMKSRGLWGNTEIDVWLPFSGDASMDDLREAALKKARQHAQAFAALSRSEITIDESGDDLTP